MNQIVKLIVFVLVTYILNTNAVIPNYYLSDELLIKETKKYLSDNGYHQVNLNALTIDNRTATAKFIFFQVQDNRGSKLNCQTSVAFYGAEFVNFTCTSINSDNMFY